MFSQNTTPINIRSNAELVVEGYTLFLMVVNRCLLWDLRFVN